MHEGANQSMLAVKMITKMFLLITSTPFAMNPQNALRLLADDPRGTAAGLMSP
jgi:hypothetical protein